MTILLRGLGTDIAMDVDRTSGGAIKGRLRQAWSACLTEPVGEALPYVVTTATTTRPLDSDALLDRTSSGVTQLLIDARSTELLMLHASGLATRDGRTIACVAPSGTGKTTLALNAGARFRYVTDETVGIRVDGRIDVYPKPLSIKTEAGGPKSQLSPAELGLHAWLPHEPPPVLGRIVLLERETGDESGDVRFDAVSLVDAIVALVPQISFLSRLDRPLQRLAGVIGWTGGVVRAHYAEAADLLGRLEALTGRGPRSHSAPPLTDRETAATMLTWSKSVERLGAPGSYRAAPVKDMLIRDSECLALVEGTVYRLSAVGGALLVMLASSSSLDELTAALERIFGKPPERDARTLAREALDALLEIGLVDTVLT